MRARYAARRPRQARASLACGLGALPLAWQGLKLEQRVGLGYAFAGGLMFSASVYNLLMPAFTFGSDGPPALAAVLKTLFGMAGGAALLWLFGGTALNLALAVLVFAHRDYP